MNVSCNGLNDGSVTLNVAGGTPPYQYQWSTGHTTASLVGVGEGAYWVVVSDNAGCLADTLYFTVGAPSAINAIALINNVTCPGANDGSIDIQLTGGTPPYQYQWSNAGTTEDITGLSGGVYHLIVTDSAGCVSDTFSFGVFEPSPITISIDSLSPVSCQGNSDGAIYISASGGTPPYGFHWSNGATTEDITGLGAGVYSLVVTDANGCVSDTFIVATLNAPAAVQLSGTVNNPACDGGDDGSITVVATGGVAPYNYYWSTGDTTNTLAGLTAGAYTVVVTDANGCSSTDTYNVVEGSNIVISTGIINATCGNANGAVTAAVSGGVPPYSFIWSNGNTNAVNSGLSAGIYELTVVDSNGCSKVASVVVDNISDIQLGFVVNNAICGGGASSGSIDLTVSGAVPPITY
ncbi:MAG: adhesin, partial [Chloroflexi bacterium]